MLEPILGSKNAERVLLYIYARKQGYAREIARYWGSDPDSIQKQLARLERGGVLDSRSEGRTRIYRMNPRYSFRKPLEQLFEKAIQFLPPEERERLVMVRRRPRRAGKPL